MTSDKTDDLLEQAEPLERDEQDEEEGEAMAEHEGGSGLAGFFGGLLLGALIGAGIALLVAPERGDVTRRRIRTKLRDVTDGAREHLEDWRDGAERELRRRRRSLRRRLHRAES